MPGDAPALPAATDRVRERDRPLVAQLCYGTLRLAPRLQALLDAREAQARQAAAPAAAGGDGAL